MSLGIYYCIYRKEVVEVLTTISKWGNSLGIRIPKAILNASGMKEMDDVSVSVEDSRIIITKAMPTSIKELFGSYSDLNNQEEIDWGEPEGEEIW